MYLLGCLTLIHDSWSRVLLLHAEQLVHHRFFGIALLPLLRWGAISQNSPWRSVRFGLFNISPFFQLEFANHRLFVNGPADCFKERNRRFYQEHK